MRKGPAGSAAWLGEIARIRSNGMTDALPTMLPILHCLSMPKNGRMILLLLTMLAARGALAEPANAVLTFPAPDEPPPLAGVSGEALPSLPLKLDGALKKNLDFWVKVNSQYY